MHVINFSHQNFFCCHCFLRSAEDLLCSIYSIQQSALVGQSMVCSQNGVLGMAGETDCSPLMLTGLWLVCNWFVLAEFPRGNQLWWWGLRWTKWVAPSWRGRKEGDTAPVSTAVLLWCLFYKLSQKGFTIYRRWTMMFNLMVIVLSLVVVLEGRWVYCQIYSLSPLRT